MALVAGPRGLFRLRRFRRRYRPVRRRLLQHLAAGSPAHRSPAANPPRTGLGRARRRGDYSGAVGRPTRRRVHGYFPGRVLGPAALRGAVAGGHAYQYGRHAEHRGEPDLLLPGSEGPEHRRRHGLLIIADRHTPGLPGYPGGDLYRGTRRWRQPAADPADNTGLSTGAHAVSGRTLQGLRPGGQRIRTQRRRGYRRAEIPVRGDAGW